MKVKVCWGPSKSQHVKGCRLGRPLCRYRRAKTDKYCVCNCGAYHFPHRNKSGVCGDPGRMWAELDRPLRAGRPL